MSISQQIDVVGLVLPALFDGFRSSVRFFRWNNSIKRQFTTAVGVALEVKHGTFQAGFHHFHDAFGVLTKVCEVVVVGEGRRLDG